MEKHITVEMNEEQLQKFIASLEFGFQYSRGEDTLEIKVRMPEGGLVTLFSATKTEGVWSVTTPRRFLKSEECVSAA